MNLSGSKTSASNISMRHRRIFFHFYIIGFLSLRAIIWLFSIFIMCMSRCVCSKNSIACCLVIESWTALGPWFLAVSVFRIHCLLLRILITQCIIDGIASFLHHWKAWNQRFKMTFYWRFCESRCKSYLTVKLDRCMEKMIDEIIKKIGDVIEKVVVYIANLEFSSNKRKKIIYNFIFVIINRCIKIIKYISIIIKCDNAKLTKKILKKLFLILICLSI